MLYAVGLCMVFVSSHAVSAQPEGWEPGGPKYLYIKPKKKPVHHGIYDESMKCVECHKYDGVDAYTSATMTLKKSTVGRMPRSDIEQAIRETLKGKGDYREIFVLSTSFDNKPLATVIEFVLDPETFTLYGSSEKQTEKLFHMASNPQVSLGYMKQLPDHQYFREPLGVQIVGKATLLKGTDPGFTEAMNVYLPTLPMPETGEMQELVQMKEKMEALVRQTKIITRITPERIVVLNRAFKEKGFHSVQIWEPAEKGSP